MKKKNVWRIGICIFILVLLALGSRLSIWGGEERAENIAEPRIVGWENVVYMGGQDDISVVGEDIRDVTYSSGNAEIVRVNSSGNVIPVKQGTAAITAEVVYGSEKNLQTRKLSYSIKVLDDAEKYFVFSGGANTGIEKLTSRGKGLREIHIPSYHKGRRVDKVFCGALSHNKNVEKIFIGDNVVSLGYDSHEEGIDWDAVCGDSCPNLREIHIGRNLQFWNEYFLDSPLEKITVNPENHFLQAKENVLCSKADYEEGESYLLCYPREKGDRVYAVPEGVTVIGASSFKNCKNIEKVVLPSTLEKIGSEAFEDSGLTEADIPAGAKLESHVFCKCKRLKKVILPNHLELGGENFSGCIALETVIVPNTARKCAGDNFAGCLRLQCFQMAEGKSDFETRDGILYKKHTLVVYPPGKMDSSYRVPDDIKYIQDQGFYCAAGLQELTLGKSVEKVGEYAFENCRALKKIHLNKALTRLGFGAFRGCRSLVRIHFSKHVKEIEVDNGVYYEEPFEGCRSLEEISVDAANRHYASVDGVLFDKARKRMYRYPSSKAGKKYAVPKTVEKIEEQAFCGTRYLQRVTLGNQVREIGMAAFREAVALKYITLSRRLKKWDYDVFLGCKNLRRIEIPDQVTYVERMAFRGCRSLREVVLGKNVEYISEDAFEDCVNLQKIVFKGKKWCRMNCLGDVDEVTFQGVGSRDYGKLSVYLPKCSKEQEAQYRRGLRKNGLHRRASVRFG